MRIEREIPSAAITYESWMQGARWQLLFLERLGIMLCVYFTRTLIPRSTGFLNGGLASFCKPALKSASFLHLTLSP